MSNNANYRQQWAEGEIEAGTLLDAIDSLQYANFQLAQKFGVAHAEAEALRAENLRLRADYSEACDDAMTVARKLRAVEAELAAQSAPAGEREALERELLSVLDFSESNLRRVVDHLLAAGYSRAVAGRARRHQ